MKHTIDDFILNDIDPDKGLKGKSITLIAISILLLFIIIIVSRSIFAPDGNQSSTTVDKPTTTKSKVVEKQTPIKNPIKHQVKTNETSNTPMYYVQVGTFKKDPSNRLLNIIKSSGFNYVVGEYQKTGTKRVLIGPYKTNNDAKSELKTIKTRIANDAYITKTKVN